MSLTLASTDVQLPSPIPQGLDRYTDRREMARGGNGILEACYDQVIGRTVALKMLLPKFRHSKVHRRRLLREARVTAQLQHPGTVAVYEIGESEDVGIYYVMKRISGENFFDVLKGIAQKKEEYIKDFPLGRRVEIIRNVCLTLAYAHARGIVHRDVKPANIWVGNFGEVVLLDWGAAKVWGQPGMDTELSSGPLYRRRTDIDRMGEPIEHPEQEPWIKGLTESQELIGTPTYMSPEQIRCGSIDERSDVFSIGVCLYEAIAIREPFRGADREETFDNICYRQPTPPSERSPEHQIPDALDEVVSRCLAKQPAARFQAMRKIAASLDQFISN